jgi:hypothetical protein
MIKWGMKYNHFLLITGLAHGRVGYTASSSESLEVRLFPEIL